MHVDCSRSSEAPVRSPDVVISNNFMNSAFNDDQVMDNEEGLFFLYTGFVLFFPRYGIVQTYSIMFTCSIPRFPYAGHDWCCFWIISWSFSVCWIITRPVRRLYNAQWEPTLFSYHRFLTFCHAMYSRFLTFFVLWCRAIESILCFWYPSGNPLLDS